ncbi:hypothetical protein [Hymenobacter cellulosilyticus]|uniref:Uncharacterized protein n=1 Tax=Hymenobacter cellulosilyticus TaxID=2932248 RepID=A0A8T9QHW0_9BACT|nr:hypothetical protein [Hymenobacter cellulosilyticus]UOQ75189.1 hypothetical protein MUN79_28790 [Hymenobacter cellulosilyticus]
MALPLYSLSVMIFSASNCNRLGYLARLTKSTLVFIVCSPLFFACSDQDKAVDPAPAPKTHTVLIEYFPFRVPANFGATVTSQSALPDGTQVANKNSVAVSGDTFGYYSETVSEDRNFTVRASYLNRSVSGLPYPYDANLRVQIKVDGKVRRNFEVPSLIQPGDTYPSLGYTILSTEW